MILKFSQIVFFGGWAVNYFGPFEVSSLLIAIAAAVIAIYLIATG